MTHPTPPAAASVPGDAAIAQAFREGKARHSSSQIGHEQWIEGRAIEIQSAKPSGVAGDDFDLSAVARMLQVYSGTTTAHANGDAMEASALSRQLTDAPPIARQALAQQPAVVDGVMVPQGKKHDGPCWRNSHADCGC